MQVIMDKSINMAKGEEKQPTCGSALVGASRKTSDEDGGPCPHLPGGETGRSGKHRRATS